MFNVLLFGFFGGAIRGVVGFLKHQFSYRKVPFNLPYFLGMSTISGIIGLSVASAVSGIGLTFNGLFSPALSFIIGYAGGDFIENIYKIIIKKSSLYSQNEK